MLRMGFGIHDGGSRDLAKQWSERMLSSAGAKESGGNNPPAVVGHSDLAAPAPRNPVALLAPLYKPQSRVKYMMHLYLEAASMYID